MIMGMPFSRKQKKWREFFHACPDCQGDGFKMVNQYEWRSQMTTIKRLDCRTCKGIGKLSDTDMAERMEQLLLK